MLTTVQIGLVVGIGVLLVLIFAFCLWVRRGPKPGQVLLEGWLGLDDVNAFKYDPRVDLPSLHAMSAKK